MGFITDLVVTLVDDDKNLWKLASELIYIDNDNDYHTVPTGFVCDFASVPPFPLTQYLFKTADTHRPAVLHDYYCVERTIPQKEADHLFYEALLNEGVNKLKAKLMWSAVRMYSKIKGKD